METVHLESTIYYKDGFNPFCQYAISSFCEESLISGEDTPRRFYVENEVHCRELSANWVVAEYTFDKGILVAVPRSSLSEEELGVRATWLLKVLRGAVGRGGARKVRGRLVCVNYTRRYYTATRGPTSGKVLLGVHTRISAHAAEENCAAAHTLFTLLALANLSSDLLGLIGFTSFPHWGPFTRQEWDTVIERASSNLRGANKTSLWTIVRMLRTAAHPNIPANLRALLGSTQYFSKLYRPPNISGSQTFLERL